MQTSDPVINPEQANTPPAVEAPINQKPVSGKPIAIWLLLTLVVILFGATGFFAHKYYALKQQVDQPPAVSTPPAKVTTTSLSPTLSPKPTADPISDWKIYKNEDFEIQLKYPSDWELRIVEKSWADKLFGIFLNKKDLAQEPVTLPGDTTEKASYSISFVVMSNPQNYSAKDFYLNQFSLNSRSTAEKEIELIGIGDLDGIRYLEGAAPSSGAVTVILVARGNKTYRFEYSAMAHPETHEKFISVFDQVLSTFEFTN
jgi:hypothetical protein